ncbi:MAG TPA: DUF5063 domain-containing protein [Williamwhitmania sp.]|nr:DUF5063 domain-containing protein [Williamwhitmania sp.]
MTEFEEAGQLVYSKPVLEFTTVANEVCKFIENPTSLEVASLLGTLQKVLPFLYMKATLLPQTELLFDDGNEKFVTEEEWQAIRNRLLAIIGKYDSYVELMDEETETDEAKVSSISENLADIYQDLKDYSSLFQIGAEQIMNDALWEIKYNFQRYWGIKVLSTMSTIHRLLENPENLTSSEEVEKIERDTSNWIISRKQEEYKKK